MKVCIKGAAEQVKMGEIDDVCLDFDRILLATDGSEPAILATQYAVTLAKTLGASLTAIFVDDGMEKLEYPEEIEADDTWEGYHPSIKGLGIAKIMAERNDVPVEVAVIQGGIAKRIIKTAEEYGRRHDHSRRDRSHGPEAARHGQHRRDRSARCADTRSCVQSRLVATDT